MKKLFFVLVSAFALLSCQEKDKEEVVIPIDRTKLVGEWICINGNSATNLTFTGSSGVAIKTYKNLSDNFSTIDDDGAWNYYPESQVLRFSFYYYSYPDMSIIELNKNTMKLRNRDLNTVESYVRVVGSYGIITNESDSIKTNTIGEPVSFSSSNTNVASVSNDGVVKGESSGISFITVSSNADTVLVKVDVKNRPDYYAEELKCTIDDIIAIHGQPDISGDLGNNKGVLYNVSLRDSKLSTIQYHYDNETREITRILTVYKNDTDWESDGNIIKKDYVDGGNGTSYWDNAYYPASTLLFEVFYKEKGKSRVRKEHNEPFKSVVPIDPDDLKPIDIDPFKVIQYDYYISYGNIPYYQIHKYF